MKTFILSAAAVVACGTLGLSAQASEPNSRKVTKSEEICKVSPDRKIMQCTYQGTDSAGNSVY